MPTVTQPRTENVYHPRIAKPCSSRMTICVFFHFALPLQLSTTLVCCVAPPQSGERWAQKDAKHQQPRRRCCLSRPLHGKSSASWPYARGHVISDWSFKTIFNSCYLDISDSIKGSSRSARVMTTSDNQVCVSARLERDWRLSRHPGIASKMHFATDMKKKITHIP